MKDFYSKKEAILMMEKGIKMSHVFFENYEWITIDNGEFLFEDGVRCDFETFWKYRTDKSYDEAWSEF